MPSCSIRSSVPSSNRMKRSRSLRTSCGAWCKHTHSTAHFDQPVIIQLLICAGNSNGSAENRSDLAHGGIAHRGNEASYIVTTRALS